MSTRIILLITVFSCFFTSYSQEKKAATDSTLIGYQKIEKIAKKSKFTTSLHRLIFKSTSVKQTGIKTTQIVSNYLQFEGKIIRKISIQTLDPFGFSDSDSTKTPRHFASKAGNAVHIKTKKFTIRNILLIEENEPFDSLKVKETERLIRSQRFVRRVTIYTENVPGSSADSVDVKITVLDSWSLIPTPSATTKKASYELLERNFLGSGHSWDNKYTHELDDKRRAFSTRYIIPNIKNTYIQTTLNYQIDVNKDYSKYIEIERKFFSPLTRWAGGILLENRLLKDSLIDSNSNYELQTFKYGTIDTWGGQSTPILKGNSETERTTNLIATLRYYKRNYERRISEDFDPYAFYSNEAFWLAGIGVSSRKYVKDEYIFNYNITEDVPIGKYYGITAGIQDKNDNTRFYVGARATLGDYFKWGYFSTNYEYGTFFNDGKNEQSAFLAELYYFTRLFEPGKWKIRQFFKSNMVFGGHRVDIKGDQLSINEANGITGFNDAKLIGTKKMIFSFQTQSYSPWELAGFRFNPFFNYTLAFIGDSENGFKKSEGFSKIGLGILLSNDYLVFSTFQFSIAFYPKIPNEGRNIFRTNNFNTRDFGYLDFEINKPRTVFYE
jgi:hypothetical protein